MVSPDITGPAQPLKSTPRPTPVQEMPTRATSAKESRINLGRTCLSQVEANVEDPALRHTFLELLANDIVLFRKPEVEISLSMLAGAEEAGHGTGS